MSGQDERTGLLPKGNAHETEEHAKIDVGSEAGDAASASNWRNMNNNSIFFNNATFSSLEEMKGSLLETCCPGDGVLSGALSLITTAATPSMLAVPLAFAIGGWTFAACTITFCIVITFLSVRILALASLSADSDDYETVAAFFLGSKGKWGVRAVLFLYNFGAAIVYLSFIKDSITPVLVGRCTFLPAWMRSSAGGTLFLLLAMFVITPLTFNSRLASLRTKGFVSNLFTVFIIFSIAYRYVVPSPATKLAGATAAAPGKQMSTPLKNKQLIILLPYLFVGPIYLFSYEVQSNVMAVIKDLHDRTGHKILVSVTLALLVITSFYILLGIFGSLTFPNLSSGNILTMYNAQDDLLMMVCQLLCCFSAAISFVFCIFPARLAVFMFISGGGGTKIPKGTRTKLGISLSIIAAILAIFLPDVAEMVSVLGAMFSATLSMTFPALFAIKMRSSGTYLTSFVDGVLNVLLLVMGVGFSVVGTFMATVFTGADKA